MYHGCYYLKWRFSLILNLLSISTCLMNLGRVLQVQGLFILKLPWHFKFINLTMVIKCHISYIIRLISGYPVE